METCKVCGQPVDLPFICSYCGSRYCVYHRLPEAHSCPNLVLARPPAKMEWVPRREAKRRVIGLPSSKEMLRIGAALLVLAFSFSYRSLHPQQLTLDPQTFTVYPEAFAIALITVGSGFILHELAHKFAAQHYGYWAEFRLWSLGLILALVLTLATDGRFIFAAPGAVYIIPTATTIMVGYEEIKRRSGLISVIGPLVNLLVAALFYASYLLGAPYNIGWGGMFINVALAAFNLLPLGILDGKKVFEYSPILWGLVAIPAWAITLFAGMLL